MKRAALLLLTIALLSLPALSYAQYTDTSNSDLENPRNYNDVEDGQLLKLASYLLGPIGYGLEWGLARPLHYAATQTSLAPIISGDTNRAYFGQNHNADKLPPGAFVTRVETYPDIAALEAEGARNPKKLPGQLTKPYHNPPVANVPYGKNPYAPASHTVPPLPSQQPAVR
ncbi:MAG: hypothetical protein ACREQ4_13955 [Candidatus Binataceae bacterium]